MVSLTVLMGKISIVIDRIEAVEERFFGGASREGKTQCNIITANHTYEVLESYDDVMNALKRKNQRYSKTKTGERGPYVSTSRSNEE